MLGTQPMREVVEGIFLLLPVAARCICAVIGLCLSTKLENWCASCSLQRLDAGAKPAPAQAATGGAALSRAAGRARAAEAASAGEMGGAGPALAAQPAGSRQRPGAAAADGGAAGPGKAKAKQGVRTQAQADTLNSAVRVAVHKEPPQPQHARAGLESICIAAPRGAAGHPRTGTQQVLKI